MPVAHKQGADRSGSEDLDENFYRLYIKLLPRDFGLQFYLSLSATYPVPVRHPRPLDGNSHQSEARNERPVTCLCLFGTAREPPARVPYGRNVPRTFLPTLLRFVMQRCFAPCEARRGLCPSTPRFFEKNRVKLFSFLYQASAA